MKNLVQVTRDMSFSHTRFTSYLRKLTTNQLLTMFLQRSKELQLQQQLVPFRGTISITCFHPTVASVTLRDVKASSLKISWKIIPEADSTGLSLPAPQGRYHLESCFGGNTVLRKQKREFWCPSNSRQTQSPCFRHTDVRGVNRKMRQTTV